MHHQIISEFEKMVNKKEAVMTSQVFLELCELKRYHDVTYSFNSDLKKICIAAKKSKDGLTCVFIPITVNEKLTFSKILNIVKLFPEKIVFAAIVQTDSTTVYYQLTDNLLEPTDTTAKHLREDKQEKLDKDLRKNRDILEQSALLGIKLTLK